MKPKANGSLSAAVLPELCHSLMERAPVPMAELEGTGHVIRYVNPAFCRLVDKVRKRLMGKTHCRNRPGRRPMSGGIRSGLPHNRS
jgi:hypothetical protein